jgi:hypothetical protein
MSNTVSNPAVIEQAAVALLAEIQKSGVDVASFGKAAKDGIIAGAKYKWVSADLVSQSQDSVDSLLTTLKQSS